MPTVQDLQDALEALAPAALAEDWDNVGLIAGDPADTLRGPVLLSIDLTAPLLDEAHAAGASALLVYHPPIFQPIKRLTALDARQALILRALRAGMSILSPHTTLDAAPGAMSDWLADTVLDPAHPRAADRRAIVPKALPRPSEECKIVTFVPAADVDKVRGALASAGAGIIGPYSACAFFATGTGSFIAGPGARPAVTSGQARHDGHLELVPEARLEMVLASRSVPLAIELLRRFHPYQEPPIDIYRLEPKPQRSAGAGRRLTLDQPVTIHQLAERVKRALGVSHVQIAPARDPAHKIARVGVCPGAGAGLVDAAAREGCELYLTGEMKHHEVLAANAKGVGILLAGHSNTERGYLPRLADHLTSALPGATFRHAACDRTLMQTV